MTYDEATMKEIARIESEITALAERINEAKNQIASGNDDADLRRQVGSMTDELYCQNDRVRRLMNIMPML